MPYYEDFLLALLPLLSLVGTFVLLAYWISRRSRHREMVHRERLAMIERGMVPPPEAAVPAMTGGAPSRVGQRFMTAGVTFIALGGAMAFIVGVAAGEPEIGVGIGGALAMVGAGMVVNALVASRASAPVPPAPPVERAPAVPPLPSEPPLRRE